MNEVKAEELMELLFLPMTDIKVVEMLDKLGAEQPIIDETYYERGRVSVHDEENSGVDFVFSELDGKSLDGEPVLTQIDFSEDYKVTLPFGIDFYDTYNQVCDKIGEKADYCFKRLPDTRQWIRPSANNIEVSVTLHFSDDELSTIESIVVSDFDRKSVEKNEFIFPCKD